MHPHRASRGATRERDMSRVTAATVSGTSSPVRLLLIPPHDPAPVTVGAPAEEDPANPPVEDVLDGRHDGLDPRALGLAFLALDEGDGDLLDGRAPPPDLEEAFGIGKGALALELHGLDEGARVHRHVLAVAHGELEEDSDEQVVGDGHHGLAEVIGALGEEPERRDGSETDAL